MDKSWIAKHKSTVEYKEGLNRFLDFAIERHSIEGKIRCPCSSCKFKKWWTRHELYNHLTQKQFPADYVKWIWHGECDPPVEVSSTAHVKENEETPETPIENTINGMFGWTSHLGSEPITSYEHVSENDETLETRMDEECTEFSGLVCDGNQELYEGCTKYSKLSFLLKLYHIKCSCGMTDQAMSMILELLKDAFEHAKVPSSLCEANNMISKLGGINVSCPVSSTPDLKFEEQFQIFQSELIETRESLKILKSLLLEYVLEKEGTLPPGFANYIGANQQLGDENSQAPKHSPMAARKSRTRKSSKGSCSYKRRFRDDDDYLKSV